MREDIRSTAKPHPLHYLFAPQPGAQISRSLVRGDADVTPAPPSDQAAGFFVNPFITIHL